VEDSTEPRRAETPLARSGADITMPSHAF